MLNYVGGGDVAVRIGITVFGTPDQPTANRWPFLPADIFTASVN
jgi:hypothetical protein